MLFDLEGWIRHRVISNDCSWAWEQYENLLLDLITQTGAQSVLEIGGGRSPLAGAHWPAQVRYAIMDISQQELDLAPAGFEKIQGDISSDTPALPPIQADIIFSKMLLEHLPDIKTAHANMYKMLRPGGICFHLHPVLYSLPMLANALIPERLSAPLLRLFQPYRTDVGIPKFPAYYDHAHINTHARNMLQQAGFASVHLLPFYGHSYYDRFPPLRHAEKKWRAVLKKYDIRPLAINCLTIVQKQA